MTERQPTAKREAPLPMHEAQLLIEDAARRMGQWPNAVPNEHQIELSKAISLKRIADAVAGDTYNSGIVHALFDLIARPYP